MNLWKNLFHFVSLEEDKDFKIFDSLAKILELNKLLKWFLKNAILHHIKKMIKFNLKTYLLGAILKIYFMTKSIEIHSKYLIPLNQLKQYSIKICFRTNH